MKRTLCGTSTVATWCLEGCEEWASTTRVHVGSKDETGVI